MEAGREAKHVLQCATGLEILALSRGLFEATVRLASRQDRQTPFDLAGELEQALNLGEWIVKAEGEEDTLPPTAKSGTAAGGQAA